MSKSRLKQNGKTSQECHRMGRTVGRDTKTDRGETRQGKVVVISGGSLGLTADGTKKELEIAECAWPRSGYEKNCELFG